MRGLDRGEAEGFVAEFGGALERGLGVLDGVADGAGDAGGVEAGFGRHLTKPVDFQTLRTAIDEVLGATPG